MENKVDIDLLNLTTTPNPAISVVNVCVPLTVKDIKIFDFTRKIVTVSKGLGVRDLRISLFGIENGVYFVKVNNNKQVTKLNVTR